MRILNLFRFFFFFAKALVVDPLHAIRVLRRQFWTFNWVGILPLIQRQIEEKHRYSDWVTKTALGDDGIARIRADLASRSDWPLISVLLPVFNSNPEFLKRALMSVQNQIYSNWELCISDDASTDPQVREILDKAKILDPRIRVYQRSTNGHISANSNSALSLCTGSFVAFLDHDDELAPEALYQVALALSKAPEAGIVYSDEDKLSVAGERYDPYFKPDWNPDLFLGQNYINHLCVVRRSLVAELGGFREGFEGSQDYDLLLRVSERLSPEKIIHIPKVLYHWRSVAGSTASKTSAKSYASEAAHKALLETLKRRSLAASIEIQKGGYNRVKYLLPERPPLVSVIICTRDQSALLEACVSGLLEQTAYPTLELVIIDNGSVEAKTVAYFDSLRKKSNVRIFRDDKVFNFSALNNFGARQAQGSVLVFLNNDIKVIHEDWLAEMVSQALRPNVGAVGAKLLFANRRIQHAGVVLGLGGVAGHAFRHFPGAAWGYFGRAQLTQNFSAVTAACMAIEKRKFEEAGGFDAVNLPIAYNDVDLCLRLKNLGYSQVWTPFATLYHLESASRGVDNLDAAKMKRLKTEAEYMKKKWGDLLSHDPAYNPNLSLDNEEFLI